MARDPKTFWGWASAVAVALPAIAAGTVHGTINALNGESFEQGFEQTSNACWDAVTELADEHADTITQGVLGAATKWATTQGLNAVNDEIQHRQHHNHHHSKCSLCKQRWCVSELGMEEILTLKGEHSNSSGSHGL